MLKFDKFSGINNVQPPYRLKQTELAVATNVDIGLDGEIRRRRGYSEVSDVCHKNLWQAQGFMLATCNGDLTRTTGASRTVLQSALGSARVWYCNLPDGRTAFSNGLINGVTDGTTTMPLGVPLAASVGDASDVSGELVPGEYRWAVTQTRLADGLEGGAVYSEPIELPSGGILIVGLPSDPAYQNNVYLSNGETFYLAGSTLASVFSYMGDNNALALPLRTGHTYPMPVGTIMAFWRGRLLTAQGNLLWASLPHSWESCDVRRDFKQFTAPITLIQPVDDGIFVGTESELAFLAGDQFDKLEYRQAISGRVALGSGVTVDAEYLKPREGGNYRGTAMICIASGEIVYGYSGGSVWRLTTQTYHTDATEVFSTWRVVDGIPQYLAVPV